MFFLSKEWQDPEDGIETVILHWTSTPLRREPDWTRADQAMVMIPQPATYPVLRRCSIWVTFPSSRKRLLTFEPEERAEGFLLHYFFEVIQRGRTWSTEASSQEIRSVAISHTDPSSECTHAFLCYSLDELENINRVPMLLEGLPAKYQFLPSFPEGMLSDKDYTVHTKRYELIAHLPPPHTFRGQIWGPKDTRTLYAAYFSREGAHNPFSEGGFWLLNDGGLWEVHL
jgi:hypothetical protein